MRAEIITIGDELLIGQTIDTNSAWIGRELTKMGFSILQKIAIPDDKEAIINELGKSLMRSNLVLVTGGLGPTKDDITKHTMCEFFGTKLVFNQQAHDNAERFVLDRGGIMNENNKSQAYVPESCTVIPNNNGTASGMWFEKDGVVLVSMPGVPHEMEQMMQETIIGKIKQYFSLPVIVIRHINTTGIAESRLAETIATWEDSLPLNCKLAYLPSPGIVKLRLTASGNDSNTLETQADTLVESLKKIIPGYIFSFDNPSIAAVVGNMLAQNKQTISVAESCTGGFIAHSITQNPGSSAYFAGSITAYSNNVKINQLSIPAGIIEANGAVSEQVVRLMAEHTMKLFGTDYAVATSGIAGPDGGTPAKPVGTVWIATSGPSGTIAKCFSMGADRLRVIERASVAALNMVRLEMLKQ